MLVDFFVGVAAAAAAALRAVHCVLVAIANVVVSCCCWCCYCRLFSIFCCLVLFENLRVSVEVSQPFRQFVRTLARSLLVQHLDRLFVLSLASGVKLRFVVVVKTQLARVEISLCFYVYAKKCFFFNESC